VFGNLSARKPFVRGPGKKRNTCVPPTRADSSNIDRVRHAMKQPEVRWVESLNWMGGITLSDVGSQGST
jgi:hypothetical protein